MLCEFRRFQEKLKQVIREFYGTRWTDTIRKNKPLYSLRFVSKHIYEMESVS